MVHTLKAQISVTENSETTACAPALGRWRPVVTKGDLVQPGEALGELEILNQRHVVILPNATSVLRVSALSSPTGWSPVDFGAPLLTLEPLSLLDGSQNRSDDRPLDGDLTLPPNTRPIKAPIEGLFYHAASPDDPPFIKEGDLIRHGHIVGLIEVMKFFYDIPFELKGFDDGARVVKVTVNDAETVTPGQVLAYVVPA